MGDDFDTMVYVMYYMSVDMGEDGTITCPDSCNTVLDGAATDISDCRCKHNGYNETARQDKTHLLKFFEHALAPDSRDPSSNWDDDVLQNMLTGLDELSYETVLMLCDTLFMLGTPSSFMPPYAASVEPFFWAVHENLERMWHYPA